MSRDTFSHAAASSAGVPGSDYAVSRLTELMCLATLRAYVGEHHVEQGWFRTITQRELSRAMAAPHRDPGRPCGLCDKEHDGLPLVYGADAP